MGNAANDKLIASAVQVIEKRFARRRHTIENTIDALDYLRLKLANLEREEFLVVFLNTRHAVISFETMFRGSVRECPVFPREIARAALRHNATAVLLAHNHPSGNPEPSHADLVLRDAIVVALRLFDIRVIDHIVIGGARHVSLNDRDAVYGTAAAVAAKTRISKGRKKSRPRKGTP